MKKAVITGSAGLIGAETVRFFCERSFRVIGIDNDMRAYFFGKEASTQSVARWLKETYKDKYIHYAVDIRDKKKVESIFKKYTPEVIIHTAAQPSHDWAAQEPFTDFEINANGTLNLLEYCRQYCPQAVFIFTSTNKVYGDLPNKLPLVELETRWEIEENHPFYNGIDEAMSIDSSLHSLFGSSKVAADILVQEYGRYFGLKTVSFRGGCLTGPLHKGARLHGFLAYLARCIAKGNPYTIYGYKGKQVRDNIHSYDLVNAFWHFYQNPRCGEIYNIGGGRFANISVNEAIVFFEKAFHKKATVHYCAQARRGDHMWYISHMGKFRTHYPQWEYIYDMDKTMNEIYAQYKSA